MFRCCGREYFHLFETYDACEIRNSRYKNSSTMLTRTEEKFVTVIGKKFFLTCWKRNDYVYSIDEKFLNENCITLSKAREEIFCCCE